MKCSNIGLMMVKFPSGILYISPIEVAKKLESVYKDPEKWWQSKKVQSARNNFVERFTNTSKYWKHEWIDVYKKVKKFV